MPASHSSHGAGATNALPPSSVDKLKQFDRRTPRPKTVYIMVSQQCTPRSTPIKNTVPQAATFVTTMAATVGSVLGSTFELVPHRTKLVMCLTKVISELSSRLSKPAPPKGPEPIGAPPFHCHSPSPWRRGRQPLHRNVACLEVGFRLGVKSSVTIFNLLLDLETLRNR